MEDRAFNIFLMIIIGMPGIAILVVAATRPMPLAEMFLTIAIGLAGLFWVLIRALSLKSLPAEKVQVETGAETRHNNDSK